MTLNVLIVLLIAAAVHIHPCQSANKAQTKSATTGTSQTVGNAIQTSNEAAKQEGITKVKTGDLCKGNPEHGDPTSFVHT